MVKTLSDLGIPEEQARVYSDRLHQGHYLVIVDGTEDDIGRAESIFSDWLTPQVYKLLERAGAALCLPVSPTVPLDICLTAPWTYIRMHSGQWGTGYSDEELSTWATRIRSFLQQGVDVYIYFNNDPDGHAIRDAKRLYTFLNY